MVEVLLSFVDKLDEQERQREAAVVRKQDLGRLRNEGILCINQPLFGSQLTLEGLKRNIQIIWAGEEDGPWNYNMLPSHEDAYGCDVGFKTPIEILDEIQKYPREAKIETITMYLREHRPFIGNPYDYLLYYDVNRKAEEHAQAKRQQLSSNKINLHMSLEKEVRSLGVEVEWVSELKDTNSVSTHIPLMFNGDNLLAKLQRDPKEIVKEMLQDKMMPSSLKKVFLYHNEESLRLYYFCV